MASRTDKVIPRVSRMVQTFLQLPSQLDLMVSFHQPRGHVMNGQESALGSDLVKETLHRAKVRVLAKDCLDRYWRLAPLVTLCLLPFCPGCLPLLTSQSLCLPKLIITQIHHSKKEV